MLRGGRRFVVLVLAATLCACSEQQPQYIQGYAEGEYVRVAAPFAGSLERLNVKRGTEVLQGAPLFALEQVNEAAARREAVERLRTAEATLDNLRKAKRAPEIDAIKAQQAQAEASLRASTASLRR